VGGDLGTVEMGKRADLIVVGADPLESIANLRQLRLVFKDGRIVSDKR
jgi:imidazolonepropionase-like amidohydrolase